MLKLNLVASYTLLCLCTLITLNTIKSSIDMSIHQLIHCHDYRAGSLWKTVSLAIQLYIKLFLLRSHPDWKINGLFGATH